MNPGIKILPLPSAKYLLGGQMSGQRSGQLLVLRMGNYLRRWMKHNLAFRMKMWERNEKHNALLFSVRVFEIFHQKPKNIISNQHGDGSLHSCSRPIWKITKINKILNEIVNKASLFGDQLICSKPISQSVSYIITII